jgi:hypothetical protein
MRNQTIAGRKASGRIERLQGLLMLVERAMKKAGPLKQARIISPAERRPRKEGHDLFLLSFGQGLRGEVGQCVGIIALCANRGQRGCNTQS